MVWFCTDSNWFGNKFVSLLTGFTHLAYFTLVLVIYIMTSTDKEAYVVFLEVTFGIATIVFSGILLFGLFKDRAHFLITYLIYNMMISVLCIIGFLGILFTHAKEYGAVWFLMQTVFILLNFLFFFVIRNHYLSLKSRPQNRNHA